MYKKILIGVALLFFIVIIAVSSIWFIHASAIKKEIAGKLDLLNTEDSSLTYEAITASGFPSSMTISIVKPHFTGRMDKIIANSPVRAMLTQNALPQWNEDILFDGNIKISVNAFSNKFTIVSNGSIVSKANIDGQAISLASQGDGDSICELQLKSEKSAFGNLWNFYSVVNLRERFSQDFRSFDCYTPSGKIVNSDTQEVVTSSGPMRFHIDHTPNGDLSNGRFYFMLNGMEATKASDALYTAYYKLLPPKVKPILPSVYGKQELEIDMSYNGANDFKKPEVKTLPFDISINKLHLSSNASVSDVTLRITSNINNGIRIANFAYKTEFTATELFQSLLKQEIYAVVNSVIAGTTPANPGIREKLASLSPESLENLIVTIIPNLAAQGKMVTKLEASYNGDEEFKNGQATLNGFELSSTPYGITASGSAKRDASSPMPSGNLSVSCNNCFKMIDDGMGYYNRIRHAISYMQPGKVANIDISPETVQGIKNFLLALNPNAGNDNTIKLDIVNNGQGTATVNGRNVNEVMALLNQHVSSTLQKKQNGK